MKTFELSIVCNKENEEKIDKNCKKLEKLLDFAELTGDNPDDLTHAHYGSFKLSNEQLKIAINDLIDNNIECSIEIMDSSLLPNDFNKFIR